MTWIPPGCRNRPRSPAHEEQEWLEPIQTSRVSFPLERRFTSNERRLF